MKKKSKSTLGGYVVLSSNISSNLDLNFGKHKGKGYCRKDLVIEVCYIMKNQNKKIKFLYLAT